jgi:hypothetical protein
MENDRTKLCSLGHLEQHVGYVVFKANQASLGGRKQLAYLDLLLGSRYVTTPQFDPQVD